jgi:hypothetical protein
MRGSCNQETGECEYTPKAAVCGSACSINHCTGEHRAAGWIVVLRGDTSTTEQGRVARFRGIFGVDLDQGHALSHHLHRFQNPLIEDGSCRLYRGFEWGESDQQEFLPWDVGEIRIEGLAEDVVLVPDAWGYYDVVDQTSVLPEDGDLVSVHAEGGLLGPFSLQAEGVPAFDGIGIVSMPVSGPAVVEWTPADTDTRVEIVLMTGNHVGHGLSAAIVCDAPDSEGRVEIAEDMVHYFRENHSYLPIRWPRHSMRYRRDIQSPYGGEIELTVGVIRETNVQIELQMR